MKRSIALIVIFSILATFAVACHKKTAAEGEEGAPAKKSRKARAAKETTETSEASESKVAMQKGAALYVIIDRGISDSMTDYQIRNRNQVGDYMDEDLIRLLKKAGYNARLISKHSERSGGYLLVVKITNYNPGSAAARYAVGYGAGAASMNIHYDLYGEGSSAIKADNLGVGSGRDWRYVVRKLGEQTTRAVSEKLTK